MLGSATVCLSFDRRDNGLAVPAKRKHRGRRGHRYCSSDSAVDEKLMASLKVDGELKTAMFIWWMQDLHWGWQGRGHDAWRDRPRDRPRSPSDVTRRQTAFRPFNL